MPIWLRKFTFNNIQEFYEEQQKEYDKASKGSETLTNKTKVFKPPANAPTYTTKASKK